MSLDFEELDYRPTPIGALSLRRRRELKLGVDVFEIKLGDEFLMSKSSREGQCPAVPSGYEHSLRRACSMPRATGRTLALLPSGGSMKGERASDEFFDPTAGSGRTAPSIF